VRPASLLGKAVRYALNQWESLTRVLEDVNIALDNNIAESAMRIIATGRKNFVFFGNNDAGQNLAMLQTLVSTCIANGVNPQEYLEAVLTRVESTPASRIDELLPKNWKKTA
jgi:transposase